MWKIAAGVVFVAVMAGGWYLYSTSAGTLAIEPSHGRVDLSERLPGSWERVCIIAPYSSSAHAEAILGVPVNIELRSRIGRLDSIALLVTLSGEDVSGFYEIPRGSVDFASLGGQCYNRDDAEFTVPEAGHPHASHV